MSRGSTWTNSDGLVVGFGTHSTDNDVSAVRGGTEKTLEVEILLSSLSDAFAAANRKPQDVIIPRGSVVTEAYLTTLVAAVSAGGGTLDIGFFGTNGSADDPNGLVDAVTVAEMTSIGEVHVCDGAMVATAGQTAVGVTATSDCVIAPSYDTAVFTAGKVRLTMKYIVPAGSTDGSIAAV